MQLRHLLVALIFAQLSTAAVEVRSGRFAVIADTGPAFATQVASHLETTADRLAELGFAVSRRELPITVFVFDTTAEFEQYQSNSSGRAFAVTTNDRLIIALDSSAPGDPWIALAHEYGHLVTDDRTLMPWFREGMAEFLALQLPYGNPPISTPAVIAALLSRPWLSSADWLGASDQSADVRHELFYAQSWLAISWLASTQKTPLRQLEPAHLEEQISTYGLDAVLLQLRAHAAQLALEPEVASVTPLIRSDFATRSLSELEHVAWRAELHRSVHGNSASEALLLTLASNEAPPPLVHAGLAALAIERGQLASAEGHLRTAVTDPNATALTRHRYALMLLRPSGDAPDARARLAARHTTQALDQVPEHPEFVRTLAQALVVAGEWDTAVASLSQLRSTPGWAQAASDDFRELVRRRWQRMYQVDAPRIPVEPWVSDTTFAQAPLAPLRPRHDYPWPPPGTSIMAGRIAGVTCSDNQKLIVMKNALFQIHFVEPSNQPAKLHHPPLKWKTIPCGTSGWLVNIAYIPYRGRGALKGEVRAILF